MSMDIIIWTVGFILGIPAVGMIIHLITDEPL